MKHAFFVLFNQQTQSLFTNAMFFFPFMFHLTCICKPAVLPQMISLFWWSFIQWLFLIYPHWFLLYPFTKSVGFVSFFSPMQHSHIHTVFKHYHEQDAMIDKQKFVQCHHWLVKIGEKKQDEVGKNELCGYLQWRRHGRSGHWVRKIPANQNTGNI